MGIDYNKLKFFLTAVDCGGVTAAAKKLHRTQSAVSQAILALEKQLGVKLIQWEGKRLQLTREGQMVYSSASTRLEAIDEQLAAICTSGQEIAGCIEIGMLNDYSTRLDALLFHKIAAFRSIYPHVTFNVHVQTSSRIEQALLEQELDIGFFINFQALHRFKTYEITTERHFVVASPEYRNSQKSLKSVAEVIHADLIDIDPHFTCFTPWVNFHAPALLSELGKKKPVISVPDFRLIRELVLQAQGCAVLPQYLIEHDLAHGKIVQVLPNLLALRVWVNGATLLGRNLRLCEQLFLQNLQQ